MIDGTTILLLPSIFPDFLLFQFIFIKLSYIYQPYLLITNTTKKKISQIGLVVSEIAVSYFRVYKYIYIFF